MRRRVWIIGTVSAIVTGSALAQFSIGPTLTFDPSVMAKVLLQTEQLLKEYTLLQQTYATTQNTYNVILSNARMITGKDGWRYAASPLIYPSASNAYGTSGGWVATLNTGMDSARNYELATSRVTNPYSMVSRLSTYGQNQFAQHYATVELNDAAAQQAMSVTGSVRANAASQAQALARLQSDVLSNSADQNTEIGVLNKVNAAGMIHAQAIQDTNRMLAAQVDQQTIELKARHDALVDEINASVAAQAATEQNTQAIWSGDRAAHNTRIP